MSMPSLLQPIAEEKSDFKEMGKYAAQDCKSKPNQITNTLEVLYNNIVDKASLNKEGIEKIKASLRDRIAAENKEKERLNSEIQTARHKIDDLQDEVKKIETGKGTPDYISFVIATIITLLLSFYLWTFYAASGYAALNGVKSGTRGFAAVFSALSEAFNKGGFLVVLTILFPTVFLGLGFLINDALEKKKYGFIITLLLFTFCLDAIIGYKISESIYANALISGELEKPWDPEFVLTDLNFYLVLASGFVCYIMWGFLLNYTLNKWKEIQPDAMIKSLKDKIRELLKVIAENDAAVRSANVNIEKWSSDIRAFESGRVNIDVPELRANVGEFMQGWAAFTTVMFNTNQAEAYLKEAEGLKDQWLNAKIASLINID